jgi:hypothetical protein
VLIVEAKTGSARDRRRGWLTLKLRMVSQGKNTRNGEDARVEVERRRRWIWEQAVNEGRSRRWRIGLDRIG